MNEVGGRQRRFALELKISPHRSCSQVSAFSSRFWSERHRLPLATESPFEPIRGRFCLDDSCLRLEVRSFFFNAPHSANRT